MIKEIKNLQNRLKEIIDISYQVFCHKIVEGQITIDNEASLQLQLGVIMKTIGLVYEFSPNDTFTINLEYVIKDENILTWKSQQKARIDIFLRLSDGINSCSAAIELKYFPKTEGETVTDNRFAILADIENLEAYINLGIADMGFFILFTTNKNYTTDTRSMVKIGNETPISGTIRSNNRIVTLRDNYHLHWDSFYKNNYFFLLQPIKSANNQR